MSNDVYIPDWVEGFLQKPYQQKKKMRAIGRTAFRNNKYVTNLKIRNWTKDEILSFFRTYNVTKKRQLETLRYCKGIKSPYLTNVNKFFPTFDDCVKEAFNISQLPIEIDGMEIIKRCLRYGIKNGVEYRKIRKNFPDIFPSYERTKKIFGSFVHFSTIIKNCKKEVVLEKYIVLFKSLGRIPTTKECRDFGVDIRFLLSTYSKSELLQVVDEIGFKMGI